MTPFKHQQGTTLLEVLVSVIVIAVGLLGIAGMQLNAIKHNHSAELRSIAVSQANAMLERMVANHNGVQSGVYNNISGTPSNPNCTSCTSSQIAQKDANEWNTANANLLPMGQGTVVGNNRRFIITVRWDNDRTGAAGLGCSGNNAVDLTCFLLEVQL